MATLLVTGGAGFVGSNLACLLKQDRKRDRIIALDNLKRRGSELNLARLKENGVEFFHGDIRQRDDLLALPKIDTILECSAEPSVLAGINESPDYLISTNLGGTMNCLELARRDSANFIFLSTSRVYPIRTINELKYEEAETRFELANQQETVGASPAGFNEEFPLGGVRSLYGATKLASELIIQEYFNTYGLNGVINRCGILTGTWQMGKVDQGIIAFWAAAHIYNSPLAYFGYGGEGKQVRDLLHIKDLYRLLQVQMDDLTRHTGQVYNVGGGRDISISLNELTALCAEYSGNKIKVASKPEDRVADIRLYLSDCARINKATGWQPEISAASIVEEMTGWIQSNKERLAPIFT